MSAPQAPRQVVDLDALADPTYCLADDVAPDGFVRFETEDDVQEWAADQRVVRATVSLVSDGEDRIEGAAGEVFEITVRRVTR